MRKKYYMIFVGLLLLVVICFQYFGYSSNNLDDQSIQDFKEKYQLNLTDDHWKYKIYSKNTLINAKPAFYQITNPFIQQNGYNISIDMSEGDQIFEISLPAMLFKNKRKNVMIEQQIIHNNIDMIVQVVEIEDEDIILEYKACLRVLFKYNDCLYRFTFTQSPSISYSINSTEIHDKDINECLDIIDTLFIY